MTSEPSWRATLWFTVLIQLIMGLAYSISAPFMPLFISDLGVSSQAMVAIWSGAVVSVTPLAATITSPMWGSLSDRVGRKPMLVRACVAITFFMALTGWVGNVWQLLGTRLFQGVFSGSQGAAIALVGSQVPEKRLGFSLGWLATGQTVGILIGPLIGGALADSLHSYRAVFFWSSAVSSLGALVAIFFIRERFTRPKPHTRVHVPLRQYIVTLVREGKVLPVMLVLFLGQFAAVCVQPVIALYVREMVGNVAWLATAAGAAFSITGISDLISAPFLGRRSDQIGYRKVLLISLCGAALFTLMQAFTHNFASFLFARFGVGIFLGGIMPTANALVGRLTPPAERGRMYGIALSAMFLGMCLGPLVGGLLSAFFGIPVMFLFAGSCLAANAAYVYFRVAEVDTSYA